MKLIAVFLTTTTLPLFAQWLNYPDARTPRTKDGKPNLTAPAPRLNGKIDLSGVWRTEFAAAGEIERLFGFDTKTFVVPGDDPSTFSKYSFNIMADFKPEEAPIRPETAALLGARRRPGGGDATCLPMGLPRADLFNFAPFKVIQAPYEIAVLYEAGGSYRQIFTDGRKLPADPQPAWMGYSVGRWEGDTLVVDATGFTDKSALDILGHPHSEALRIQERFHRRDFGHIDLSLTIDDPKMYTRPFTVQVTEVLIPDTDVLEYICNENEKDLVHFGNR